MKLKDKIVLTAIDLFNKHGIANISPNKIAEVLQISVGNLTYHYHAKEDLLNAILQKIKSDSSDFFEINATPNLSDFMAFLKKFEDLQFAYRCFFNDIVFITNKYPAIGNKFIQLSNERLNKSESIINYFIQSGIFLPKSQTVNYNLLIHSVWIVNTFWFSQEQIAKTHKVIASHKRLAVIKNMIYPYLTPKGIAELNAL